MVQQHIRLGDLLVKAGLLTEEKRHSILEAQHGTKKRLGQLLIDKGFLSEEELMQALARQFDLDILQPDALDNIEPRLLKLGPETLARHHTVLPVQGSGQTLYIATADPLNVVAVNDLQHATRLRICLRLAPASMIQRAIERHYTNLLAERHLERIIQQDDAITISTAAEAEESTVDPIRLKRQVDHPPRHRRVNNILHP